MAIMRSSRTVLVCLNNTNCKSIFSAHFKHPVLPNEAFVAGKVRHVGQHLTHLLRRHAEPLREPVPHTLPRRRRDEPPARANGVRALVVKLRRVRAVDLAPFQAAAEHDVVAAPRVVRARAVGSQRPAEVARADDGDVFPHALVDHLRVEARQRRVDDVELRRGRHDRRNPRHGLGSLGA